MATAMYNRSSSVEEFLKSHRSRLSEDKMKQENKTTGMRGGILPNDEGRYQSIQQRRNERQLEYQKYLQDHESPSRRRVSETMSSNNPRPPSNSINEIRKQLQKEREKEISFDTNSYSKTSNRGMDTPTTEKPTAEYVSGLGGIGYRIEESPEEKRQRQSRYREELMKQMKEKTSRKMGNTKLFEEEERKPSKQRRQPSPPVDRRERNTIKFSFDEPEDRNNGSYDDDITGEEKIRFDHNHYRPSQYREYPYYPPPPGPHPPPPGPPPHYGYPPYYYPTQYPHMYPPPAHQPPYYPSAYDSNPYTGRYGRTATPTYQSHSPPSSPPQQSHHRKSSRTSIKSSKQLNDKAIVGRTDSRTEFRTFLDQQVKEKKEREAKEQSEIDKLYRKIEAEADVYDPWGKPGGGAPLTDAIGNVVTERGQLRKSYDDSISPRMSEEDRKKLVQEKTKRELEEQIKENKERQMREKYEKQRLDEEEERKINEDLKKMNIKDKLEIEEERKKKQQQLTDQENQKTMIIQEQPLSARELAELRFKEDLEKRKKKEKEEKERLDRLADKMASDSTPAWKQRNPSPPIPALQKNKMAASEIPPYRVTQQQQQPTITSRVPSPQIQPQLPTNAQPQSYQQPANAPGPSPQIQSQPYQQPTNARVPSPQIHVQHQQPANALPPQSYQQPANGPGQSPQIQHQQPAYAPPQIQPQSYQQPANAPGQSPQIQHQPYQIPSTQPTFTDRAPSPSYQPARVQFPTAHIENTTQYNHMSGFNQQPQTYSNQEQDHSQITSQAQHTTTATTYQPIVPDMTHNRRSSRPSRVRDDNDHANNNHSLSATPRIINRQPSQELLQNFSVLKNQIRRTVSSTGGGEAPPFMRRQSQPPPLRTDRNDPTLNIERHANNEATRPPPRISSGLSNFTIATMQIDSLANRNQERARRLDEIMNNSNRTASQNNPRDILTEFLQRRNE